MLGDQKDGVVEGKCKLCPATRQFPAYPGIVVDNSVHYPIEEGGEEKVMSAIFDRHKFYEENKENILNDVSNLGLKATRKKWRIPYGTWTGLKRRWGLAVSPKRRYSAKPIDQASKAPVPNCTACPLKQRLDFLEGYHQAILDCIVQRGVGENDLRPINTPAGGGSKETPCPSEETMPSLRA